MLKKLKIGVNGRFFCQPYSGIGRYCLNLFPELARQNPEMDFYIGIPEDLTPEVDLALRGINNLRFELVPEKGWLKRIHPGLAKADWEKELLSKFFISEEVDLVHIPYPALYKRWDDIPVMVTVHDAIPWVDEEYFRRNRLSEVYNNWTLKSSLKADFLLTVSEQSAKEILWLEGFQMDKIAVVYNASEFDLDTEIEPQVAERLMQRLGLERNDQFLFYMGGYDKRKNVARLVEIFLTEIALHSDFKLVLGGNAILSNSLFEMINIKDSPYADRVIKTGFLSNQELMTLYGSAWAFWSMTTREGFNLPLLEALTLGLPALVSNLPVHHEVAGDTPFYLDLNASNLEIGKAILALQKDTSEYNELQTRTAEFSKTAGQRFSWSRAAEQVAAIYQELTK